MPPSLSELKFLPSFCFAFKIPDDVTATNFHARHLQQIHWSKLVCGMYGLTAKSSIARLNIYQILMRFRYQFSSLKLHNCGHTNEHCWWITPLNIRLKGGGWWLSNMFCCWQICMYWFLSFFCVYFAKLQKEKNLFYVCTLYQNLLENWDGTRHLLDVSWRF